MKLIVGLGNVGDSYKNSRHNLGFRVVTKLAEDHRAKIIKKPVWQALLAMTEVSGQRVVFLMPTTMMNLSGSAVKTAARHYNIGPEDVWVVYDELDLPFAEIRVKDGGGSAGHNGVKSVIEAIGPDFKRWRIGIGKPDNKAGTVDWVLQNFTPEEQAKVPEIVASVAEQIEQALNQ